jgi:hypothetical protein
MSLNLVNCKIVMHHSVFGCVWLAIAGLLVESTPLTKKVHRGGIVSNELNAKELSKETSALSIGSKASTTLQPGKENLNLFDSDSESLEKLRQDLIRVAVSTDSDTEEESDHFRGDSMRKNLGRNASDADDEQPLKMGGEKTTPRHPKYNETQSSDTASGTEGAILTEDSGPDNASSMSSWTVSRVTSGSSESRSIEDIEEESETISNEYIAVPDREEILSKPEEAKPISADDRSVQDLRAVLGDLRTIVQKIKVDSEKSVHPTIIDSAETVITSIDGLCELLVLKENPWDKIWDKILTPSGPIYERFEPPSGPNYKFLEPPQRWF